MIGPSDTVIPFDRPGEFAAFNAAVDLLRSHGFSVGSMQGPDPVGAIYRPGVTVVVAKWRNMTQAQRDQLHATITGESKRNGPVLLTIFARAPAAAHAAIKRSNAA